ncbi:uncharacterized protein BJ171DRAFT_487016 [Polychytrium aggregatum]|uniref:uncharacterized protein n=1 Tax=Polychytrium aggregatum TaxID=110093 RepID=UPI0022FE5056|nr:uncharacterized protein BJ171DRAFT_487016 [Polychytrium aggregatum]KAI9209450.1 hypothetical protein BJ171DRAFT_487016 [Polychytrium aggregatum]
MTQDQMQIDQAVDQTVEASPGLPGSIVEASQPEHLRNWNRAVAEHTRQRPRVHQMLEQMKIRLQVAAFRIASGRVQGPLSNLEKSVKKRCLDRQKMLAASTRGALAVLPSRDGRGDGTTGSKGSKSAEAGISSGSGKTSNEESPALKQDAQLGHDSPSTEALRAAFGLPSRRQTAVARAHIREPAAQTSRVPARPHSILGSSRGRCESHSLPSGGGSGQNRTGSTFASWMTTEGLDTVPIQALAGVESSRTNHGSVSAAPGELRGQDATDDAIGAAGPSRMNALSSAETVAAGSNADSHSEPGSGRLCSMEDAIIECASHSPYAQPPTALAAEPRMRTD